MNLELDPDLDRTIDDLIRDGGFHSRSEVVREGILLLKAKDSLRRAQLENLRTEIKIGIDQIRQGDVHDADVVFDRLLEGLPDSDEETV
jgi:antitoxin ParD1/3/4